MRTTADRNKVIEVRTGFRDDGNAVVAEVADTGPGIDPKQTADIFDAFVTTKPDGIGLGLAICRRIVERHGGEISVAAADPQGAVFRITLPHAGPPH